MKLKTFIILFITHAMVGAFGFAAGIYTLPILTAPEAPDHQLMATSAAQARYQATFTKDLADSDFLHQAEGAVMIGDQQISFNGAMSPGPDYILYLSPEFVETEVRFNQLKPRMQAIGAIKSFDGFIVDVPASVNIDQYNTVVVWCESFGQFITAAQYR